MLRRRTVLTGALAGAGALAAPRIGRAQGKSELKFIPQGDLASLDPMWTTADVTRNHSLAVFDTLYGLDAGFMPQPQMVAGATTSSDGKQWDLTLRDGLKFHDGTPVLAKDCVASIKRFGVRDALGSALLARVDEISAPSDKKISFKLKTPFALLPNALAQYACAIMPERLAQTDPGKQVTEMVGSGPFRFVAAERVPGSRVVYEKFTDYVPRPDGKPSFMAGPKIVHFDRVVWTVSPDPATNSAALINGEYDWWENPAIDLVGSLKANKDIVVTVKDRTGEIGCLRFNSLLPPFDNPAIRRVVLQAVDQKEYMEAVAGAQPELIKNDVGIFVPGTPMASKVGVEITRGPKDMAKLKQALAAAGYKGEKIVVLAAGNYPTIYAEAQVANDMLQKMGFNVDFQTMDWGTVVQRRASKEPTDKGGWNIFFTLLGGTGNISPATNIAIRGSGANAWFGWPSDPKMEDLRNQWFAAPDLASQQKLCEAMQVQFYTNPSYVPLGMFDQPTAYRKTITDIPDGWPQFYGVRRV